MPLSDKAHEVYALNYSGDLQQAQAEIKRPWWKLW